MKKDFKNIAILKQYNNQDNGKTNATNNVSIEDVIKTETVEVLDLENKKQEQAADINQLSVALKNARLL